MKQGKFGICLSFYAILSFVLAVLNQPVLCGILLGFVILAEGDRWAIRQVVQGFLLSLVVSFFTGISYAVGSWASIPFRVVFGWYNNYDFVNTVQGVFSFIVYAVAIVFSIMAILRLCHDQEANLPLLSPLSYRIFGEQKPRPVKQQPVFPQGNYPQPPVQYPQQMQGQPMPPMQGQPPVPPQSMPPFQVPQVPQPPQGAAPAPQPVPDLPQNPAVPAPAAQPEQQPPQQ